MLKINKKTIALAIIGRLFFEYKETWAVAFSTLAPFVVNAD